MEKEICTICWGTGKQVMCTSVRCILKGSCGHGDEITCLACMGAGYFYIVDNTDDPPRPVADSGEE
jgi:hypothetical protein